MKTCHKCQRSGHFANVCRSAKGINSVSADTLEFSTIDISHL
jgi:hypothetical protein